ncbi:class I SAM-dependent methyltransferase [Sphaerimonospora sp. CA-214678]|uniref:class I SAM-dependent methyltransferase n=1 Tax=Sphaerimonospora sp. CA-214678 TaxID=3240029 RepID=UPI003D939D4D
MSVEFDEAYWEERYRSHTAVHERPPNPQLVAEAGDLRPGRALDAGCGEGAEAIWLAARGWHVTAADIASTALRRAREQAEALGDDVMNRIGMNRIDWVQADLTAWTRGHEITLHDAVLRARRRP